MATLASLKLVASKKSQQSPVQHRRHKLSIKILEQIKFATAQSKGETYAPTRTKIITNAEGQRVQVTQSKICKPWWFSDANGKVCLAIKYGARTIELSKGKTAIEVASAEALIAALETVNAATLAGELDSQIEALSGQIRGGFNR
jgi:hypothetical protein